LRLRPCGPGAVVVLCYAEGKMRGARRVVLLAITVILASVGASYYMQRAKQAREAPPPPVELPPNTDAASTNWVHTEYRAGEPKVEIRAARMRQVRKPSQFELEGVELRIFNAAARQYDRVRCARARFDLDNAMLYSEGEVEITLAVPEQGPPGERLMVIRSSGVRFDTTTGEATTDQPASFTFDRAEGRCVGATYHPGWRDLRMRSDVLLRWHPNERGGQTMQVEAGRLVYKEDQSRVYLSPWSRFTRGPLTLEAGDSVITLEDGALRAVDADDARGHTTYRKQRIDYAAGHLVLHFTAAGALERIVGERDAKAVATSPSGVTTVTGDRLFLNFKPAGADSVLDNALTMGEGTLRSQPRPRPDGLAPPTRILRSEVIKAVMRAGGEEIERIEVEAPGTAEFLPGDSDQKRRQLQGQRMSFQYGPRNQLLSVRAIQAVTRTESSPAAGRKPLPPTLTWSDDLLARFDPATGEMTRLEQWGNFRYQQGSRRATSEKAMMDAARNLIVLEGKARLADDTGSTAADQIILNQAEEIFTATGHVASSRLPESGGSAGGMISQEQSLDATAERMTATADGSYVVYEGKAVVWQGANRLCADRVEIDREHRTLVAKGHVSSQFLDQGSDDGKGGRYTEVQADRMTYIDEHRVAHYTGGVHLKRVGLEMTSSEMRVFFKSDGKAGPNLDHTLADGAVKIVLTSSGRTRTAFAGHAEYYAAEEKVILRGGRPRIIDSLRGTTQGNELTYYAANDRLLVDGAESRPAVSRLRR